MPGTLLFTACTALATQLAVFEPTLTNIKVLDQLPTKIANYPAVIVQPQRNQRWVHFYEDAVKDGAGDTIFTVPESLPTAAAGPIMDVGELEVSVNLWCAAKNAPEREDVQGRLMRALLQEEGAPGRLQVQIPSVVIGSVVTVYEANITFIAAGEDVQWKSEKVFSERRWFGIELQTTIPILVIRTAISQVLDFRLIFDADLDADLSGGATPADKIALINDPEEWQIDENGNTTPI